MSIFGFGYDEHNDDYKVLYAYYSNKGDENVILMYSFKYESWKRSDRGSSSGFVNPIIIVFVSGNLNWCNNNLDDSDWEWNIISFSLTTETAKAIALPNYKHEATIFISESRRLLFAVFHPLTRGLDNTAYMAMCNAKLSIAHVYENGDILMMVRHQLKLHRPNGKRGKNFNIPYVLGYMTFGVVLRFPFGEGFQMITLYGLAGKQKIPLQEPKNSNPPSGIKTELLVHM
nr:F-box/kelch-repeat protein At3g23880-like [Ipomoea batatas]